MSHDFSLDRKKIVLVSTISVALAFLIFMAGWMAGIMANISRTPSQEIRLSGQRDAAMSKPTTAPDTAPQKLIADNQKTAVDQLSQKPETAASSQDVSETKAAAPKVSVPIVVKPEPQKMPAVPEKAAEKSETALTEKRAFSAATVKDVQHSLSSLTQKDVQRDDQSEEEAKASEQPEASKEPQPAQKPLAQGKVFTVQVASYIAMQNAVRTANDLTAKGYEVLILKKRDPRGKTWFAVQIGEYKDRGEASRAASEFTEKEGIVAIAMPIASYLLKERKGPDSFVTPKGEETLSDSARKDAQSEVKTQ
jgi:cell division septation protein DedD